MHFLFLAVRFYPWWAIPTAVIIAQLGGHFVRTGSKLRFPCFGIAGAIGMSVVLWAIFRGDLNSDHWVRWFLAGI